MHFTTIRVLGRVWLSGAMVIALAAFPVAAWDGSASGGKPTVSTGADGGTMLSNSARAATAQTDAAATGPTAEAPTPTRDGTPASSDTPAAGPTAETPATRITLRMPQSAKGPEASDNPARAQTGPSNHRDSGSVGVSAGSPEAGKGPAGVGSARGNVEEHPAGSNEEPIKPIPDPQYSAPVDIEAASFKGVTPGVSASEEVRNTWGPPGEIANQDGMLMHLYSVEPFNRVEVTYVNDVVNSIVIRLQKVFPARAVARQLELANVEPVLVSNELGEILGQAFPERGVLFAFEASKEPGKVTMMVGQIILEPISAEPFVLRAETNLDSQYERSLHDLDQAIKLAPRHDRAHWLRSRVLASMGRRAEGLDASLQAIGLNPNNPRYRITHAQILGQIGRYAEAIGEAEKALAASDRWPHVKARALCLLGDLVSSGPKEDFKRAVEYHTEAVKLADPLAASRHPAIRLAAKEVLIDAHLGAASDIAWGTWKQKEPAVAKWLQSAAEIAEELVEDDGGTEEFRFRVAARALAAHVGVQGKLDPADWAAKSLEAGRRLIDATRDPLQKRQYRWDLGMALYDALQIYQMRNENELALQYGKQATEYLEQASPQGQDTQAYNYLLGRLYFRLGAIHAVAEQNHRAAVTWFGKAIGLLEKPIPDGARHDLGRHGETFVSMGVSYWEVGERQKALELTQLGVEFMEQAVNDGLLAESVLAVPYGNLATMHRQLGQNTTAEKFSQMAAESRGVKQR